MVEYKDISVVIQGPIDRGENRLEQGITYQSIAGIRRFLPGAKIILSTWQGQDVSGLSVDDVIFNEDPGALILSYNADGSPNPGNENRQIVSSLNGIKAANTSYVLKLRADVLLTSSKFVDHYNHYQHDSKERLFKNRVLVSNMYFRQTVAGYPIIYCQSDWMQFGLKEDLLTIWDLPLFKDLPFDPKKAGQPQHFGVPHMIRATEQTYCRLWLQKLDPNRPDVIHRHSHSHEPEAIQYWHKFIAHNLIILDHKEFSFTVPKRHHNVLESHNCMHYYDWLALYKKYCDPSINIKDWRYTKLKIRRMIEFPLARLRARKMVAPNR